MTKTTNYQLPQWEAHDPVRREDFNEAFAALDGVYGPEQKPYECGTISIAGGAAEGTVVKTFGFVPNCVLLTLVTTTLILNGGSGTVYTSVVAATTYYRSFSLSGQKLTFTKGTHSSIVTIPYIAFR